MSVRAQLVALAVAALAVVAATAFVTSGRRDAPPDPEAPPTPTIEHSGLYSFDGARIVFTVFRPAGASEAEPVPVVLHSHGWAGSRATNLSGIVGKLVDAGFGVVSIDARGHGESEGFAAVQHRDHEVKDYQLVLDWIHDNLAWVRKEPSSGVPKDVVAGGAGYSYAGALQLMTASYDARLDALVPEITWSYLPDALAPDGAVKSVWIDTLYASAKQSGTRVDPRLDEWFAMALATNELPVEALDHFVGSSPLPARIEADVLLVQGLPDVLFNVNHALWTYEALSANPQNDVRLLTHLTGHVVPTMQPLGTMQERRETFADEGPCGTVSDIVVAWMDEHLRDGNASGIPEVSFALDKGTCVAFDALPNASEDVEIGAVAVPSGAGSLLLPVRDGPALIVGAPRLTGEPGVVTVPTRAFASLVIVGADGAIRVVDDQARPFRVVPDQPLDVEMVAVAARLDPGDRLFLRIDGANEWFFHNSPRTPGIAMLESVVLKLPVAEEPEGRSPHASTYQDTSAPAGQD